MILSQWAEHRTSLFTLVHNLSDLRNYKSAGRIHLWFYPPSLLSRRVGLCLYNSPEDFCSDASTFIGRKAMSLTKQGQMKNILGNALKNLDQQSFYSFKRSLHGTKWKEFSCIPLSQLENGDPEEVGGVIVDHYTIHDAPGVTVNVLKIIGKRQSSQDLIEELKGINIVVEDKTLKFVSTLGSPEKCEGNSGLATTCDQKPIEEDIKNSASPQNSSLTENGTPSRSQPARGAKMALKMEDVEKTPTAAQKKGRRSKLWPDIDLTPPTEKQVKLMLEYHKGKPEKYAVLLFKHYVPEETYRKWVENNNTNIDGYRGKRAIPSNLREAIMDEVREKFPNLNEEDKGKIRSEINRLLSKQDNNYSRALI